MKEEIYGTEPIQNLIFGMKILKIQNFMQIKKMQSQKKIIYYVTSSLENKF